MDQAQPLTDGTGGGSAAGGPLFDPAELVERYRVADRATPHLRVNFIASLDGAATRDGLSGGLNNPADKQVFDVLRMLSDVVLVGAGTLRTEGYGAIRLDPPASAWREAHGLPPHPALAIVSGSLGIDPASPMLTDAPVRPLVMTHAGSPVAAREALAAVTEVVVCGEREVEPARLRRGLADRGMPQMLCEGGPRLLGALVAEDALDELCLTLSPVLEGGDAVRIARGGAQRTLEMALVHALPAEDMLMLRYVRRR